MLTQVHQMMYQQFGLGNEYITPDSLGPKVISNIEITRHIIKYLPEYVEEGTRPISAISPGVLGTTGIETLEILEGIVGNVKPKLLIVIDALASRSIERISSTIQISDTGIVPGAGVRKHKKRTEHRYFGNTSRGTRHTNSCRKCSSCK